MPNTRYRDQEEAGLHEALQAVRKKAVSWLGPTAVRLHRGRGLPWEENPSWRPQHAQHALRGATWSSDVSYYADTGVMHMPSCNQLQEFDTNRWLFERDFLPIFFFFFSSKDPINKVFSWKLLKQMKKRKCIFGMESSIRCCICGSIACTAHWQCFSLPWLHSVASLHGFVTVARSD